MMNLSYSVIEGREIENPAIQVKLTLLKTHNLKTQDIIYNSMIEFTVCMTVSRRRIAAAMTEIDAHGLLK